MATVLHISASPKGANSASEHLARAFSERYAAAHPQHEIVRLNVFEADLPLFGRTEAEAKFAPFYGEEVTPPQAAAWEKVLAVFTQFSAADKILLSCPMWNYSIPWALKLYFDCLVQPGRTFGYDREAMAHTALLKNRPTQFLLTRSSIVPGHHHDFQLPYLKFIFSSIGLNDVRVLSAWQTSQGSKEERAAYLERFALEAAAAAENF